MMFLRKPALLVSTAVIFFLGVRSYAADNVALMQCLGHEDKTESIACLQKNFPLFVSGYECLLCTDAQKEEYQRRKLEKLLELWQVLYSQCQSGIAASDCIAQIDISRCKDAVGVKVDEDGDTVIGGLGEGTCYALAAFLKRNATICENQFYSSTQMNCNVWLEALSLDCLNCADGSLIAENEKGYFNWLDGARASMRDISYCEKMVDREEKDNCFSHAARALKNVNYCDQVSEEPQFPGISPETRRDSCYSDCAVAAEKEEWCDKVTYSQRRDVCHNFVRFQRRENLKKHKGPNGIQN